MGALCASLSKSPFSARNRAASAAHACGSGSAVSYDSGRGHGGGPRRARVRAYRRRASSPRATHAVDEDAPGLAAALHRDSRQDDVADAIYIRGLEGGVIGQEQPRMMDAIGHGKARLAILVLPEGMQAEVASRKNPGLHSRLFQGRDDR